MERRPQRPHYTQTLWGEPVRQRRSAKPRMKQVRELGQPALRPSAPTEHIIEGTFLSHNKDATHHDRPRLQRRGAGSLSNTELFPFVLRTKQSNESIEPRLHNLLANYTMQELLSVEFGVLREQYKLGDAQAAQLQATLEVARRLLLPSDEKLHQIRTPGDAADLLRSEMEFLDHEEMRVLLLDTKHGVLANQLLYRGTVDSSVLRAAEIFRPAVTRNCPKVIIAQTHPSGDPEASQEDIKVTEQLVEAGSLLDVEL